MLSRRAGSFIVLFQIAGIGLISFIISNVSAYRKRLRLSYGMQPMTRWYRVS